MVRIKVDSTLPVGFLKRFYRKGNPLCREVIIDEKTLYMQPDYEYKEGILGTDNEMLSFHGYMEQLPENFNRKNSKVFYNDELFSISKYMENKQVGQFSIMVVKVNDIDGNRENLSEA